MTPGELEVQAWDRYQRELSARAIPPGHQRELFAAGSPESVTFWRRCWIACLVEAACTGSFPKVGGGRVSVLTRSTVTRSPAAVSHAC